MDVSETADANEEIAGGAWDSLRRHIKQVETLLGSNVPRPRRWNDLIRNLHFGLVRDFHDIVKHDWPSVKPELEKGLFSQNDPILVEVGDLSELVGIKPVDTIPTKLNWATLNDEDFERLIFSIISNQPGYENPEWLMATRAADRGRDLSVTHVSNDPLLGSRRSRVIIQCKHWQQKSVSVNEIATLKEQMALWGDPRVDLLIIATSGRFTSDAVAAVERHNASNNALRIEMWPESALERLRHAARAYR